jgi:hypothetical protein
MIEKVRDEALELDGEDEAVEVDDVLDAPRD